MHWKSALRAIIFNDPLRRPWVRTIFGVLLLYPFLHNPVLFAVNFGTEAILGKRVLPQVNLLLIGLKEALLIFALLFFSVRTSFFVTGVSTSALLAAYMLFGVVGVKTLWIPCVALTLLILNRATLKNLIGRYGTTLAKAGAVLLCLFLLFGLLETKHRSKLNLDSENWETYLPLVSNNHYRCAKFHLDKNIQPSQIDDCDHTPLNFYKIEYLGRDQYLAHSVLFFPYGDSVIFSILLFYSLIFCCVGILNSSSTPRPWQLLLPAFFASGVIVAFSRVHALLAVIALVSMALGLLIEGKKPKTTRLLLFTYPIPLVLFIKNWTYLVGSLFESNTPSNLGHFEAFKSATGQDHGSIVSSLAAASNQMIPRTGAVIDQAVSFLLLALPLPLLMKRLHRPWLIGYCVAVVCFISLGEKYGIPAGLNIRSLYTGPTESDFLRAIVSFGAAGVLSHSLILGFIGARLFELLRSAFQSQFGSVRFFAGGLLCLMTLQFLMYQLIAPYVISGYVLFASFLLIWFPLTENYLTPKKQNECL